MCGIYVSQVALIFYEVIRPVEAVPVRNLRWWCREDYSDSGYPVPQWADDGFNSLFYRSISSVLCWSLRQ